MAGGVSEGTWEAFGQFFLHTLSWRENSYTDTRKYIKKFNHRTLSVIFYETCIKEGPNTHTVICRAWVFSGDG